MDTPNLPLDEETLREIAKELTIWIVKQRYYPGANLRSARTKTKMLVWTELSARDLGYDPETVARFSHNLFSNERSTSAKLYTKIALGIIERNYNVLSSLTTIEIVEDVKKLGFSTEDSKKFSILIISRVANSLVFQVLTS